MRKIALMTVALLAIGLAGCNTVAGFGKDIERAAPPFSAGPTDRQSRDVLMRAFSQRDELVAARDRASDDRRRCEQAIFFLIDLHRRHVRRPRVERLFERLIDENLHTPRRRHRP